MNKLQNRSGFTEMDSAGTIQMAVMSKYLKDLGFVLWDFGMHMSYKEGFGSKPTPRMEFLRLLHENRDKLVEFPVKPPCQLNAKDFLSSGKEEEE